MVLRLLLGLAVVIAAGLGLVIVWALSGSTAFGAAPLADVPCRPYDLAIQQFANAGWTIHDDIVLPRGFEVDRLLVVEFGGQVVAAPVVNGCIPAFSMPLGLRVEGVRGDPA